MAKHITDVTIAMTTIMVIVMKMSAKYLFMNLTPCFRCSKLTDITDKTIALIHTSLLGIRSKYQDLRPQDPYAQLQQRTRPSRDTTEGIRSKHKP